ncbi:MAG: aldolase/citrate lyase family protein [Candidatus Omnitrophica bacterium]|nr:aldolase/citrate lyase family protein [Candidatus Omnitrophota bacterium]MDD5352387.1 aldolase/citrate lyase family protein [Candidatus Omnitrophota bacterium]MDD5549985.1 aldolase/citrate lyase family protein [Candidatus Omnitrophota bacterium]
MKIKNGLKNKLNNRKTTIGSWIQIAHPAVAEIMAQAGFEWLAIDLEHSTIELHQAQLLIQTIQSYNVVPLVRVSSNDAVQIKRVMDAGAAGVIVPNVNSEEDAQMAVAYIKYPPLGKRGVGLARAQGYGFEFEEYKKWVNKDSIVVVQIEHIDAINNLEEILSVDGVDASIIGPYDLSASLGCAGNFNKKEVKNSIKKYLTVCRKLNKPAGFHVINPESEELKNKIKQGFSFLALSIDTILLGNKCRTELVKIKEIL